MSWSKLEEAQAKANKVLGSDATMPPENPDLQGLMDKSNEAWDKFTKGRDALEDLLESYEDTIDAFTNGLKRVAAAYQTTDFGLDKKKKEDAKKIEQAHKIFSALFASTSRNAADVKKDFDELQKHLVQLGKYKGPGK